jgi:quinoprotein glucose dehydrogenase
VGFCSIPGTRGGAEWGGAAVDPEHGVMYVNANEVPLLIKMKQVDLAGNEELLSGAGQRIYTLNNCTMCHGGDRAGTNVYPSLQGLSKRKSEEQVATVLKSGKGQMPAYPNLSKDDTEALLAFLFDKKDKQDMPVGQTNQKQKKYRYVHDGWNILYDQFDYPGVKPPWGTLNAIDLNTGEILWKVPLSNT